jgi:hypothetical protein
MSLRYLPFCRLQKDMHGFRFDVEAEFSTTSVLRQYFVQFYTNYLKSHFENYFKQNLVFRFGLARRTYALVDLNMVC